MRLAVGWYAIGALTSNIPFVVVNQLVVSQQPQFMQWLRPTGHTSPHEIWVLTMGIAWMCASSGLALWPLRHGQRLAVWHWLIAIILASGGVLLSVALLSEIIQCRYLPATQCD